MSILILFVFGNLCAQTSDETAIKNTLQTFFDSLAEKSAEMAASVLYKDGFLFSVKDEDNNVTVSTTSHQDFIKKLPTFTGDLLEKMQNPKILIHGKIAVIWTPYTFHRDGKYSHRGVDAVQLIKTNEGWKICGILYTVEPD
jgi:hypothetical protein